MTNFPPKTFQDIYRSNIGIYYLPYVDSGPLNGLVRCMGLIPIAADKFRPCYSQMDQHMYREISQFLHKFKLSVEYFVCTSKTARNQIEGLNSTRIERFWNYSCIDWEEEGRKAPKLPNFAQHSNLGIIMQQSRYAGFEQIVKQLQICEIVVTLEDSAIVYHTAAFGRKSYVTRQEYVWGERKMYSRFRSAALYPEIFGWQIIAFTILKLQSSGIEQEWYSMYVYKQFLNRSRAIGKFDDTFQPQNIKSNVATSFVLLGVGFVLGIFVIAVETLKCKSQLTLFQFFQNLDLFKKANFSVSWINKTYNLLHVKFHLKGDGVAIKIDQGQQKSSQKLPAFGKDNQVALPPENQE